MKPIGIQPSLFDAPEERERVKERIAPAILDFARARKREFFMDDLRRHITLTVGIVAPASPDRILRQLRQQKKLDYIVVDRRRSLYKITEAA